MCDKNDQFMASSLYKCLQKCFPLQIIGTYDHSFHSVQPEKSCE